MRLILFIIRLTSITAVLHFSCPSYAHESIDEEEIQKIIQAYQQLVSAFQQYLTAPTSDEALHAGAGEVALQSHVYFRPFYLVTNGKRVFVNTSAMRQLLSTVAREGSVEEMAENPDRVAKFREHVFTLAKEGKLFLTNTVDNPFAQIEKSGRALHQSIKAKARAAEAVTHRYINSFDPSVFLVIIVSQAIWEAVESFAMPGGLHIACGWFNALLLAGVLPFEKIFLMLPFHKPEWSFSKRLYTSFWALQQFLIHRKIWFFPFNPNAALLAPIARQQTAEASENTGKMIELLKEFGFHDSAYLANYPFRMDAEALLHPSIYLATDLATVFDTTKEHSARFFVAMSHVRGFELTHNLLEQLASASREHHWLERKENLYLERIVGRLRFLTQQYGTALMMASKLSDATAAARLHETFKPTMETLVDLHAGLSKEISHAKATHEQWEHSHNHTANFDARRFGERLQVFDAHLKKASDKFNAARSSGGLLAWSKRIINTTRRLSFNKYFGQLGSCARWFRI